MNNYHNSVLLQEVIELLNIQEGGKYIDATIGGGGHSFEILKRGGKILGIDVDDDALSFVSEKLKIQNKKAQSESEIILAKGNFSDIKKIADIHAFNKVDGIIFDLGVSSHQLDSSHRGFSFKKDAPLDMRMDRNLKIKASDLINALTKDELYELFTKFGEERFARSIAASIISVRAMKPIQTTMELSNIIRQSVPYNKTKLDTAARIYQALRIAINDELNNLKTALPQALDLLAVHGKIAVISFHSLEDRIVKYQFNQWIWEDKGVSLTKKPIRPSADELRTNPRSASAKLRVFEKK